MKVLHLRNKVIVIFWTNKRGGENRMKWTHTMDIIAKSQGPNWHLANFWLSAKKKMKGTKICKQLNQSRNRFEWLNGVDDGKKFLRLYNKYVDPSAVCIVILAKYWIWYFPYSDFSAEHSVRLRTRNNNEKRNSEIFFTNNLFFFFLLVCYYL